MKRKIAVTAAFMVIMSALSVSAQEPSLNINSEDTVPLRAVFERLGYEIVWDAYTKTASVGDILKVTAGESVYYINGEQRELKTPASIIGGKMYVPASLAAEAEALRAEWIDEGTADELLRDYFGEVLSAQIVYNLAFAVEENPERVNIYADKTAEFIKSEDAIFGGEQKQEFVSVIESCGGDKDRLVERCNNFFDKISDRYSDDMLRPIEETIKRNESFAASVDAIWEEEYFKADERFADVEFINDTANYTQISGIYKDLFKTMQKRVEELPADTEDKESIREIYKAAYSLLSEYYVCIEAFDADNDVKMIFMP